MPRTGLLVLALACSLACSRRSAPAAPPPPTVLVAAVERRDVPISVEAVGTIDGWANVDIRARVRGFLLKQHYRDGTPVREGDLLFTIDPAEYEAALASAKAALSRAFANQSHARAQLERRRVLATKDIVSKQELDDAEAAAQDGDAQVEAARAALRQAELNLSYTRIRAPLSGLAGIALVRPGNLVGQDGPTLLTTVSDVDPARVNFPVSEVDYVRSPALLQRVAGRDIAWARRQFASLERGGTAEGGDPGVELLLAGGKPYPRRGVLVVANRQVDATTGTIQMQALFPNPDGLLRPGQYGRVRVRQEDQGTNVLVVPEKALLQVQGTYSLAVVGPGDKVQLRRVEVGPSAEGVRVITKGAEAGERVVVEGVQKVSDGAVVKPEPAPAATTAAATR